MSCSKLFLSLSCLQGREMESSAIELLKLNPYGIQLTPGNAPTEDFELWLKKNKINYLIHHGFCWFALRQKVWNESFECVVNANSVHPPKKNDLDDKKWKKSLENNNLPILETMYNGYYLGNGNEIEEAMILEQKLAVDISHINIQKYNNLISDKTWKKLQNYEKIEEIHISSNLGKFDSHSKISLSSYSLSWAKERINEIPIVLECYMHKLSEDERLEQISMILN